MELYYSELQVIQNKEKHDLLFEFEMEFLCFY